MREPRNSNCNLDGFIILYHIGLFLGHHDLEVKLCQDKLCEPDQDTHGCLHNNVWLWLILGNQVVELQGRISVTILHVWHNPLPLLRLSKGESLLSGQ